jgi:hypothetical protein
VTHYCEHCDREFTNPRCPRCGGAPARKSISDPIKDSRIVSEVEPRLDDMIEQASRPTLASLLRKGIKTGLIKPAHEYNTGPKP